MKIRFLGAARKVTGSCFHLAADGMELIVDCGMNQGRNSEVLNEQPFGFEPAKLETLLLTHAHLDHSGLIPKLVSEGFTGRIITTSATAELAGIILLDSAHIQEKDAEWHTKKALRAGRDETFEPLYTTEDVKDVWHTSITMVMTPFMNCPAGLNSALSTRATYSVRQRLNCGSGTTARKKRSSFRVI